MASALADLAAVMVTAAGETVTYRRQGFAPLTLTAAYGRKAPTRSAVADGRVQFEVVPMDFLIEVEDIDFGAGPVEPERGDRIELATDEIFEVMPRDGEPAARHSDPFGALWRVRTVQVV